MNSDYPALSQRLRLKHPNINRYRCAYETQDDVNFVFDFVPFNLQNILDEDPSLPQLIQSTIATTSGGQRCQFREDHWFCKGFEGVVSALQAIHSQDSQWNRRHKRLEPVNILVDMQGTLFISDFGCQAVEAVMSLPNRYATALETPDPGAAMYAPPPTFVQMQADADNGQIQGSFSVKDSVWSLGCILLETLVALVGYNTMTEGRVYYGKVAVEAFRLDRRINSIPTASFGTDMPPFWYNSQYNSPQSPGQLKARAPIIQKWPAVERVLRDLSVTGQRSLDIYLREITGVLARMLEIDKANRIVFEEILDELEAIKVKVRKEKARIETAAGSLILERINKPPTTLISPGSVIRNELQKWIDVKQAAKQFYYSSIVGGTVPGPMDVFDIPDM